MESRIVRLIGLILLLSMLFSCGEYHIADTGKPDQGADGEKEEAPDSGDLADDPNAFSVYLRYEGEMFIPKASAGMKARWTDGYSVYVADFGSDGYARISGLDGDYQVNVIGLADGYLYDPNAHVATNNSRNIAIDIYKPIRTSGYGTGAYDCIKINKTGVYRVELKSAAQKVFFQYAPTESGTYSVESWTSVADGNYNPMADVWLGSIAYKTFSYTLNDGGVSSVLGMPGGYTKNFKYVVEIAEENFSAGGGGGQAVFTFAVHADSKNGIYPTYVDIAVKLNGSFESGRAGATVVIPEENFKQTPEYDKSRYEFVGAETKTVGVEGRFEFDGNMWRLFSRDEDINGDGVGDGDGYYHLYDKTLYPENGGYGPILYAKISEPCRFVDLSFTHIEDPGNKSLTVNGTENHKLFIQGLYELLIDQPGDAGMYFCLPECPCVKTHKCNSDCPEICPDKDTCIGVCPDSCENCLADCRRLPDAVMNEIYYCHSDCTCLEVACAADCESCTEYCKKYTSLEKYGGEEAYARITLPNGMTVMLPRQLLGYATYANSDGVYAVTEELRHFLQSFSISQRMFADGNGWVEENPTVKVDATEDDQWLFACGYYKEK